MKFITLAVRQESGMRLTAYLIPLSLSSLFLLVVNYSRLMFLENETSIYSIDKSNRYTGSKKIVHFVKYEPEQFDV